MRDWSATETEVLSHFAAASSRPPVRVQRFLEEIFFSERHGRALILQPTRCFGAFYLSPETFDSEPARLEAVRQLSELMLLLAHLGGQRLVVVNRDAPAEERQVRFVGTLFRGPRQEKTRFVLNERGDYTVRPETIWSRDSRVLYRGLRLSGDLYELVARNTTGLMYVSPTIKTLCPAPPGPGRKPAPAAMPAVLASPMSRGSPPAVTLPSAERPLVGRKLLPRLGWPLLIALAGVSGWMVSGSTSGGSVLATRSECADGGPVVDSSEGSETGPAARMTPAVGLCPAGPDVRHAGTQGQLFEDAVSVVRGDPGRVYGVDVSLYSGQIDFTRVRAAGLGFVFVKATEGLTIRDPQFAAHWSGARAASILRGAYHFFIATDDGTAQAEHFLSVVGSPGDDDLPPAVDVEGKSQLDKVPVELSLSRLQTLLKTVQGRLGRVPVIYSSARVWSTYLKNAPGFGEYPLWVAFYEPAAPEPPLPPAWSRWTFWQFTDAAIVPGAATRLDFNRFNGSEALLRAFAKDSQR